VAYSIAIGASSAKRRRWKRYTCEPGLSASFSASSGVTVPCARLSQTLCGRLPRARMSSENDVSLAKFFSTRLQTKLPEPCRLTSRPSSTRPSIARRTVMRETAKSSASWRSEGSASSGPSTRLSIASRTAR
jgi:hypothetical protein